SREVLSPEILMLLSQFPIIDSRIILSTDLSERGLVGQYLPRSLLSASGKVAAIGQVSINGGRLARQARNQEEIFNLLEKRITLAIKALGEKIEFWKVKEEVASEPEGIFLIALAGLEELAEALGAKSEREIVVLSLKIKELAEKFCGEQTQKVNRPVVFLPVTEEEARERLSRIDQTVYRPGLSGTLLENKELRPILPGFPLVVSLEETDPERIRRLILAAAETSVQLRFSSK
ncbi:MAG: hypothetical protein NC911_02565, partial [Candidatus Omnitrophica bacterium]|nr:hypothetical protein [Candidatus Omnitrophota bacterium]